MLADYEQFYAGLVSEVLYTGELRKGRNGNTRAKFCKSFSMDSLDLPVLAGRRIYYKGVLGELAAMLRKPKSTADFEKFGCNYWDKWAEPDKSIVVDYGNAWRDFNGYDQLATLKKSLTENPTGRRHLISGWRPDRLAELSLPCCHLLYQWYVTNDLELEMIWYQRSVDLMVGLPSNMILASTWNQLLANELGFKPGRVHMVLGDCHIYEGHLKEVKKYLANVNELLSWKHSRKPPEIYLNLKKGAITEEFDPTLEGSIDECYDPKKPINFEVYA